MAPDRHLPSLILVKFLLGWLGQEACRVWTEVFNTQQIPPLASWPSWGWKLIPTLEHPATASLDREMLPREGSDLPKATRHGEQGWGKKQRTPGWDSF